MKLAEFKDLCDREWGEARGDVTGLTLTDESYAELQASIITSPVPSYLTLLGFTPDGDAELLNPVTRSVVKVTRGASIDSAEVYRHYGRQNARVPASKEVALEAVRSLGAAQRKTADDLRAAIREAKAAGASWSAIGRALDAVRESVFRQYECGSPIVVVRAWQNPRSQ